MKRVFLDFESLESFLSEWKSWRGDEYDFGGVVILFRACLRSMFKDSIQGDIDSLSERFGDGEKELLERLLAAVRGSSGDG